MITMMVDGAMRPVPDDAQMMTEIQDDGRLFATLRCSLPDPASEVTVFGWADKPMIFEGRTTAGDPHSTHLPYRFTGKNHR